MLLLGEQDFAASGHDSLDANSLVMVTLRQATSRAKIRNLMSVLFNHARRHDFSERNPITLVRQSAKRRTVPEVLLPSEINRLARSLRNRERTLVLLAAGTGLRMSELFGLKWQDVDFAGKQASVLRSIVKQSVGPCKM